VIDAAAGGLAQKGDDLGAPPPRLPQMPAYHLKRADRSGITMVNIGVGRRTRRPSPTTSRCCARMPG
jgi:AMP nucleosidase